MFISTLAFTQNIEVDLKDNTVHLWLDELKGTMIIGEVYTTKDGYVLEFKGDNFLLYDDDGYGEEWEIWTEYYESQIGYATWQDDDKDSKVLKLKFEFIQ